MTHLQDFPLPAGVPLPSDVVSIIEEFDARLKKGQLGQYRPIATGFSPLDEILGGGLRAEDLVILGGPQGIGKTIMILQMAADIARRGDAVALVVCYEHSRVYLLHRLLCLESIDPCQETPQGLTLKRIQEIASGYEELSGDRPSLPGLQAVLQSSPAARRSWAKITSYWERLLLASGNSLKTTLEVLETYLRWARARGPEVVLFLDYLQKVPFPAIWGGAPLNEDERISHVTAGLKHLAMTYGVPVIAVAAADTEGLRADRVRLRDMWGPSVVSYECDMALMLNPLGGPESLPRRRDQGRAKRQEVRISVDKNRHGPEGLDMAFTMHGRYFAFNPQGRLLHPRESTTTRQSLGACP